MSGWRSIKIDKDWEIVCVVCEYVSVSECVCVSVCVCVQSIISYKVQWQEWESDGECVSQSACAWERLREGESEMDDDQKLSKWVPDLSWSTFDHVYERWGERESL